MSNRKSHTNNTKQPDVSSSSSTLLCEIYNTIRPPVDYCGRRIIFGPAVFKITLAFIIIIVGSILKTLGVQPSSYFSSKNNIFNVYFAKFAWGWTLGLLMLFVPLTLITLNKNFNYYEIITRHLVRLLIATVVWYIITNLFVYIDWRTGICNHNKMKQVSRRACEKAGHEWEEGFDFSGHIFLLLYSILIMNEEIRLYDKATGKVDEAQKVEQNIGDTLSNITNQYSTLFDIITRVLYVLIAALTILWEFILLSTALYFHETFDKMAAGVIAVFFWFITYRVWYTSNRSSSILRPLSPRN
ncbi:unnamed protein product [Rotaria magnacalcarata]|uniref:Fat storage-inducing transmembrane protein n=1 Tax=Rotaria magnacalcarata TaxID=392030 RepID=A0A816NMG4_9BILA|nr:unnamed protein product [Rotaria magnacalcarata]CAF1245169.1 unnamed protein product [Rotaria magnacalcarata]CAF1968197.1 unnamed protein product [Rotaria magnacalcarata]CAF2036675.1 unnamed protein product [Rotaria magnacalcarata]CAF2253969.1 unnamed protein product [Rotaria magnacalcarata]